MRTLPAEKKRRRLPLPLFVLIGLESTAFVAVGIAAEPSSVVSVTDIAVTLGAVAVALLAIFSMSWKAARRERREARVAEEMVSLEDLHRRIQMYVPRHVQTDGSRRDIASPLLHHAGTRSPVARAPWTAPVRERGAAWAAQTLIGVDEATATRRAASDDDEGLTPWREQALTLITHREEPIPPAAAIGWKAPAVLMVAEPISLIREAPWAVVLWRSATRTKP